MKNEKKEKLKENSSIENENKEKKRKIKKKLPITKKENIKKYVNSEIIFTKSELKLLKNKISQGNKEIHVFFDILYRATKDGDNTDVIKKICKDIKKTLTLFYTEEGARFGFFIYKEISYSIFGKSLKEVPGSCFLISLNNLKIYNILEDKTATENKKDILCFIKSKQENKNRSGWAICTPSKDFLGKECILGEMKDIFDEENLELEDIIGEKNEYHLKEVEIFEVAIESDEDYYDEINQGKEEIKIDNEKNQNDTNKSQTDKSISNKNSEDNRTNEENKKSNESENSNNNINKSNKNSNKKNNDDDINNLNKNNDISINDISIKNGDENLNHKNRNENFLMTGIIKGTKYK